MHHYQALAVYYAIANTLYALPVFAARQRAACGAGAPSEITWLGVQRLNWSRIGSDKW